VKPTLLPILALLTTIPSCAPNNAPPPSPPPNAATRPITPTSASNSLQSLHVRLTIRPADGSVEYLGWYDGRRNLLGPSGITAAIVGIEPPQLNGKLSRPASNELLFDGVDQSRIRWQKRYRLDDNQVTVTYRVTNARDQEFDAIVYSLADLPDATITGDNRDQHVRTPTINAHFHATIDNPNFPGEQMTPYAMRSDSRRLEPGDSMEFHMTWELEPARAHP
jgi:hypothetical protein